MKTFIVFLSVLAITAGSFFIGSKLVKPPVAVVAQMATPTPTPVSLSSEKLWSLIQEWRQSQGLRPYIKDQRLCDIADIRIEDLQGEYSHDKFVKRYSSSPYALSENIAGSSQTEQQALEGWLNSPPHRKALNADYIYSCVRAKRTYSVQIFSNF